MVEVTRHQTAPMMTPDQTSKTNRRRPVLWLLAGAACCLVPSCAMLRGGEEDQDDAIEMTQQPRRAEMPSLTSGRVHPGKFPVVQFGGDDWKLSSSEMEKVRTVARWMAGNPERVLLAAGARAESPEYARQLSDLRAQTVRHALMDAGVPEERILTVCFGEDAPASTGNGVSFSIIGTSEPR